MIAVQIKHLQRILFDQSSFLTNGYPWPSEKKTYSLEYERSTGYIRKNYKLFRWLYMCVWEWLILLSLILHMCGMLIGVVSTYISRAEVIEYILSPKTLKNATLKTRETGRLIRNRWKWHFLCNFLWISEHDIPPYTTKETCFILIYMLAVFSSVPCVLCMPCILSIPSESAFGRLWLWDFKQKNTSCI